MERMTITERENAVKGIQNAIRNGFKQEETNKSKRLVLVLLLVAILHNIACLSEGTTIATICSISMYVVITLFIAYLDIF